MPEGDTIFRTARTLGRALAGRVITRFESVLPQLLALPLGGPVAGRVITRVESRGKHLLMWCGDDLALRTHLRMHGSWHVYRPGERWRVRSSDVRIQIDTEDWIALGVNVPEAEWLTERAVRRHPRLMALGPDVLATTVDVAEINRRVVASGATNIADVLLNQRVLAGVGNVFKSEVLFVCRVHPDTPADQLTPTQRDLIISTAIRFVRANVSETAAHHGRVTSGRLNPDEPLWVYGRAGEPCFRCGAAVRSTVSGQDARRTYWCDTCQRLPRQT